MAIATEKTVVIFSFHYSVIVRGLEKNLENRQFHVLGVATDVDGAMKYAGKTDLFIMYLSENTKENKDQYTALQEILHVIAERHQTMIVIGEKMYHEALSNEIPELKNYVWLDRPLDLEVLKMEMEKAVTSKTDYNLKKKILIVDDDPVYAKMVREWLSDRYQVSMVTAGMQAITFLAKNKIDLILLDYEMPIVDGPQVFEMLRSEPTTKTIPIIFLTGVGTREGVTRVMALKPDGYILKSASRDDIREKLKSFFG